MRPLILTLATLTSFGISAAASENGWDLIGSIEIEEIEQNDRWAVVKTFPEALQEASDMFPIGGYAMPIEAQAYIESFLLVQDPADCPFCGSGGYGPVLEVHLKRAIPKIEAGEWVDLVGRIEFDHSPDTYQAVRLVDAYFSEPAPE